MKKWAPWFIELLTYNMLMGSVLRSGWGLHGVHQRGLITEELADEI